MIWATSIVWQFVRLIENSRNHTLTTHTFHEQIKSQTCANNNQKWIETSTPQSIRFLVWILFGDKWKNWNVMTKNDQNLKIWVNALLVSTFHAIFTY